MVSYAWEMVLHYARIDIRVSQPEPELMKGLKRSRGQNKRKVGGGARDRIGKRSEPESH